MAKIMFFMISTFREKSIVEQVDLLPCDLRQNSQVQNDRILILSLSPFQKKWTLTVLFQCKFNFFTKSHFFIWSHLGYVSTGFCPGGTQGTPRRHPGHPGGHNSLWIKSVSNHMCFFDGDEKSNRFAWVLKGWPSPFTMPVHKSWRAYFHGYPGSALPLEDRRNPYSRELFGEIWGSDRQSQKNYEFESIWGVGRYVGGKIRL